MAQVDEQLISLSEEAFQAVVDEALGMSRDKPWYELANSPLAHCSLVEGCFLSGEVVSDQRRGVLVREKVLRWGIEQLRPMGNLSDDHWTERAWEDYDVLFYPYLAGMTFDQLASKANVLKPALFRRRTRALGRLARLLRKELERGKTFQERKNAVIAARYAELTANEQQLLRLATVFRKPFPVLLLHHLAQQVNLTNIPQQIQTLMQSHLLIGNHAFGRSQLEVHPEASQYLSLLLSLGERLDWHGRVAKYYQKQHDYLEAAYHLQQAGQVHALTISKTEQNREYQLAAELLVRHQQALITQGQTEQLHQMLVEFRRHELADVDLYARVKLAAGDTALLVKEVSAALTEYGEALKASKDIKLKVETYHRLGQAYKKISSEEAGTKAGLEQALTHFDRATELLEGQYPHDPLLADLYLERAWLYIDEQPDFEKAKHNLRLAEALIDMINDARRRSNLHSIWGRYYYATKQVQEELDHVLKAYTAATETGESGLLIRMAFNLGQKYVWAQRYTEGLDYLWKAQALAAKTSQKWKEGGCYKTIGASYFFQKKYDDAIKYYEKAYNIFVEVGDENWRASVCYDLAEAHTELQHIREARRYFLESQTICQRLGQKELLSYLAELVQRYTWLHELPEKYQKALDIVVRHDKITNTDYQDLCGVAKKTASNRLREMVEMGLLTRKGPPRGKGVYYTLPS